MMQLSESFASSVSIQEVVEINVNLGIGGLGEQLSVGDYDFIIGESGNGGGPRLPCIYF
jgi:hypothetical protein